MDTNTLPAVAASVNPAGSLALDLPPADHYRAPLAEPYTHLRRHAVATRCLCCNLPLADATSAALGVGPTCRKRLGLVRALKSNAAANELIARAAMAAEENRLQEVVNCLKQLEALSPEYLPLVNRTKKRLFKTRVTPDSSGGYLVTSTWNPDSVVAFRSLGLSWRPVEKAWRASDTAQRDRALAALSTINPDGEVVMPSGTVLALSSWRV